MMSKISFWLFLCALAAVNVIMAESEVETLESIEKKSNLRGIDKDTGNLPVPLDEAFDMEEEDERRLQSGNYCSWTGNCPLGGGCYSSGCATCNADRNTCLSRCGGRAYCTFGPAPAPAPAPAPSEPSYCSWTGNCPSGGGCYSSGCAPCNADRNTCLSSCGGRAYCTF